MVSKKRLYNGGFNGFVAPVVPKAPRSLRKVSHKKSPPSSEICPFELLAAVAGKLLQESGSSASTTDLKDIKQEEVKVKVKVNPLKLDYLDQGCCGESEFVPEPSVKDLPQSDNDSALEHASIISTNVNGIDDNLCDANMEKKLENQKPSEDFSAVNACNNVKISIRDDDENYFSFNKHIAKMRAYRRMRKMFNTTRHWKSVPKLKDYELSNNIGRGVKAFDQNRRSQTQADSKRRKLFYHNSKRDYVHETSSESISNIPKAKSMTYSIINHKSSYESKDGHLKFSINSFKVPDLYIEIPETSTIGSLKRTVVEAVTSILGGELHVGVLLQGEKINDDNTTLQQTGVSLNNDTLGFMLEPNTPQTRQNEPISPASPIVDVDSPEVTCEENQIENNQESQKESTEDIVDPKAIMPIRQVNPEVLAMVPLNHKVSKRSELSQRRTRRPFSVTEVEALVEAVETLGTGRWRDVKIRAFDDANHRTYVDLKDKWKTLVHTATISPQQRRGEPVPQGLLDRVLAAHSFWTRTQSKPHGKHQTEPIQVQTPQAVKV